MEREKEAIRERYNNAADRQKDGWEDGFRDALRAIEDLVLIGMSHQEALAEVQKWS